MDLDGSTAPDLESGTGTTTARVIGADSEELEHPRFRLTDHLADGTADAGAPHSEAESDVHRIRDVLLEAEAQQQQPNPAHFVLGRCGHRFHRQCLAEWVFTVHTVRHDDVSGAARPHYGCPECRAKNFLTRAERQRLLHLGFFLREQRQSSADLLILGLGCSDPEREHAQLRMLGFQEALRLARGAEYQVEPVEDPARNRYLFFVVPENCSRRRAVRGHWQSGRRSWALRFSQLLPKKWRGRVLSLCLCVRRRRINEVLARATDEARSSFSSLDEQTTTSPGMGSARPRTSRSGGSGAAPDPRTSGAGGAGACPPIAPDPAHLCCMSTLHHGSRFISVCAPAVAAPLLVPQLLLNPGVAAPCLGTCAALSCAACAAVKTGLFLERRVHVSDTFNIFHAVPNYTYFEPGFEHDCASCYGLCGTLCCIGCVIADAVSGGDRRDSIIRGGPDAMQECGDILQRFLAGYGLNMVGLFGAGCFCERFLWREARVVRRGEDGGLEGGGSEVGESGGGGGGGASASRIDGHSSGSAPVATGSGDVDGGANMVHVSRRLFRV